MQIFVQHRNILISLLISLITINCDPTTSSSAGSEGQQQSQPLSLDELVQQERELEDKAKQSIITILLSFETPTNSFFEKEATKLDESIKKAKEDSKTAEELLKEAQAVHSSLQALIAEVTKPGGRVEVDKLHPTIQAMVNKVLKISEISKALNANRPIQPNKLKKEEIKTWYQSVIASNPNLAGSNANAFITYVLWGEAQRLLSVMDAKVALFQNIHQQHQLKQRQP